MADTDSLDLDLDELAVTCPACGSKPGKPCYGNGLMRRAHQQRESEFRRALIAHARSLEAQLAEKDADSERLREQLDHFTDEYMDSVRGGRS